jgi:glutathione S-transferase
MKIFGDMRSGDPLRVERGERALEIMERQIQKSDWFVGSCITLADIALLAYTRRAHLGGFDMARRPKLGEWIARCEGKLSLLPV